LRTFQTVVSIIENHHAAFGETRDSDFSTAPPAIRSVVVDNDDIEFLPGMILQSFDSRQMAANFTRKLL
jgi:hypothetical protein